MKRILITIACLLTLCALSPAHAAGDADGFLVQIPAARLPLVRAMGVELEPACEDVYLVQRESDLAALRSAGLLIYAEANAPLTLEANPWNIDAVHVPAAWEHQNSFEQFDRRGGGVTVAIVDSGVDAGHDDLDPSRILPYKDYGNNENGVDIWHGTFVAGIIAARLDNGTGIDGAAPEVTLLPVTITTNGKSDTFTAIRGIQYAADNGADVINLSIGGGTSSAFLERTCRSAEKKGIILVAAAGNYRDSETPGANNISYPAGYDFVVSVSSCKQSIDGPVFDSDYSYFNKQVNVSAPGSKIRSLYNTSGTAVASGTSFAAPMVSAMAAIAKQVNPAIDTDTFLALLEATSTDLGDEGRDDYYGAGFVNMEAFIEKLDEQYSIHYVSEVEPAETDGELRTSYSIADGEIVLSVPSRPGWTFLGWYEDPEFTGSPVTKIPAASMGERSFYARWQQLPNGAPAPSPDAPADGAAAPASLDGLTAAVPFRADVSGWFTDPDNDSLRFTLISGKGSLDGAALVFTPEPDDAETDVPVTVRAEDGFGNAAEHTVTVHVGKRPASQPVLTDAEPLELFDPPAALILHLTLFDSRVTAVRLGTTDLDWQTADDVLRVSVPAVDEGDYEITVEFDAGSPVTCALRVARARHVHVRADAPAEGRANPPSLDGVSSATPYSADVSGWFVEPDNLPLTYEKAAGPGTLEGSNYYYNPTAAEADTDAAVTIRASDSLGHSAEHSLTIHVGPLPFSQPTLADPDDMVALDLCRPPKTVQVELLLYGAQVTAVRLEDVELTWRLVGQTLYVDVPALSPGGYDLSIEFDAGSPAVWPWHVYYGVAGPEVSDAAPAGAEISPGSSFQADVRTWFSGESLTYTLVSGPGSLDGADFTFLSAAEDADTDLPLTIRAEDAYGRSAVHTVLIHVGSAPEIRPVLDAGTLTMTACSLPKEVSAELTLNGAQLKAVRIGGEAPDWRLEDGCLTVAVPELSPGSYEIALEFDACAPVIWRWQVRECPSAAFRDVPLRAWYHSDVDWALENKLMNGMAANWFAPQDSFTRAMLVTVLYRAAGKPSAPETSPFTDVKPGRYYSAAVAWAAREGIVRGVAPDRFDPDAPVTREQLVTILFRFAGDDGVRADLRAFPDADAVSRYAKTAMAWAVGHGIVNGVGSGGAATLSPRDGAARAQVAAIMRRYLTIDHPMEAPNDD